MPTTRKMNAATSRPALASAPREPPAAAMGKFQSWSVVVAPPAGGGAGIRIVDDLAEPLFKKPGLPIAQMPFRVRLGCLGSRHKLDDRLTARCREADRYPRV